MPTATLRTPTIGEIYAAFDVDAHRLFRQAMALSRGGVVRIADLLAALCATEQIPRDQIPASWVSQISRRPDDAWITPMSNEPALRDLLVAAYRLAVARSPEHPTVITPQGMLSAAFLQTLGPRTAPVHSECPSVERRPSVAPEVSPAQKIADLRVLIDQTFRNWITAQV